MAVYWIDFMQSTNGSGTYASPFSGSVAQTLVAGDEIRIKSVLKSSIWDATFGDLTPGSYKMVYNSNKNGSGQSTNNVMFKHSTEGSISFNISYLYYIVELDVYFMTQNSSFLSSTYNSITENFIYTTSIAIPASWNDGLDHVCTVKLVSSTYRQKAHTSSRTFIGPASEAVDNITVTDGWVDATTRVTDGSVVTIYQSGYTNSMSYFYIMYLKGNSVVDLSNTIIADRAFGSSYYVQNNIDSCGVANITIGSKISTYASTVPFYLTNFNDTLVGELLITIKNYYCICTSSYVGMNIDSETTNLKVTIDIKKYAVKQCNIYVPFKNTYNNFNYKIGQLTVSNFTSYAGISGIYGTVYSAASNVLNPYLTLYGEVSQCQPQSTTVGATLLVGEAPSTVLKKIDTLFSACGIISPNTASTTFLCKNGYFSPVISTYTNSSINVALDESKNSSSYVFPSANILGVSNTKALYNIHNNQVEYNPIKTNIPNVNKSSITLFYNSSNNINNSHGNMIYFPQSDNYIYLLAKTNDSVTNEQYYTYPANRCIMEENTITYKTVAPSFKITPEGSSTYYKEFFHRWNIPVEADITYTIKFYTSMVGGLPSNYFKNYNFALRYNYNSVSTSVITAASQGGWEEHSLTITSTFAQILSLDLFLTQPQGRVTELYISDFTVTTI